MAATIYVLCMLTSITCAVMRLSSVALAPYGKADSNQPQGETQTQTPLRITFPGNRSDQIPRARNTRACTTPFASVVSSKLSES